MAVQYGLGGFKVGTAFIYATCNNDTQLSFSAVNAFSVFDGDLTDNGSMRASINGTTDYQIDLEATGYYLVNYSLTTEDASNKNFEVNISNVKTSFSNAQGAQMFNSKAGDLWTTSGCLIVKVDDTNQLFLVLKALTDDTEIVVKNVNISAIRLGGLHINTKEYIGGTAYGSLFASGGTLTYAAINTFYPFNIDLDSYNTLQIGNDSREFEIEQSGYYYFYGSFSITGSSNDDLELGLFKNGTNQEDILVFPKQKWNSKGGSAYQTGMSVILKLAKGDTIQPGIANRTDTTGTTTFQQINLVMSRIGNI
jgi:hypothetical protein